MLSSQSLQLIFPFPSNYFILHYFIHFLDVYLSNYLYCLYRFAVIPSQVSSISRPYYHVTLPLHQSRVPITFGEFGGSLMALTDRVGILSWGWKMWQMNQWVPYNLVPPLKVIYHPNYLFILNNMAPLGLELKNVSRARLGTMLYQDIQKGEEVMNTSDFK